MSLLGKSSITITDITDVNPIRLDLASSQPIYQTKRANGYEPDYTSSPLIITPSLYFGQEEVNREKYTNKITFYINGVPVVNTETIYVENTKLYIKENLRENTQIKAVISYITDDRTNVEYDTISESLSFYLLSYDSSGYTAFIESNDGRYDFSNSNNGPITLTARLFLGNSELKDGITYSWSRSSGEPLEINNEKTLTIQRADIYSHENFVCKITYEGVAYTAICPIDDRTDTYTGAIISDTSLVMTPILNTANLTCKIFRNGQEAETANINYEWVYYTIDSTEGIVIGNAKEITITLGNDNNPPKNNFSLYCIATIDSKYKVVSYLPISYSVSYTPILTPKTIFIPANSDGSFRGPETEIQKNLVFYLQGEDGSAIEADLSSFSINGGSISATKNGYRYNIPITISLEDFNNYNENTLLELNYIYKEHSFKEEFYIIKSIQGEIGETGASYSLMLTNDYHRFAGEEVYAIGGQEAFTNLRFFKGDEELNIDSIEINNIILTIDYQAIDAGLEAKINKSAPSKDIQIIFKTISKKIKEGGAIEINSNITIDGVQKTFATIFNYDINYEGNSYFFSFTNGTSISYLPSKDSFNLDKLNFYTYYRRNGLGENIPYTDGKVFVSVDGGTKERLNSDNAYYSYSITAELKNNLTFYLYNSEADDSEPQEIYLMDRETIPILISLEGAEIGGENLIRLSRLLKNEEEQWHYLMSNEDELTTQMDSDSNSAFFNFNGLGGLPTIDNANRYCSIVSPFCPMPLESIEKDFCFSCYIKTSSIDTLNLALNSGQIKFSMIIYNINDEEIVEKDILVMPNNFKIEDDLSIEENNKWYRIYNIFNLSKFEEIKNLTEIDSFKIKISAILPKDSANTFTFMIKKPKLEIGNTATAWSTANNDLLYEDLTINLDELSGSSLLQVLTNQLAKINTNSNALSLIQDGNINITVNTPTGDKTYTNLKDFYYYLNEEINQVKYLATSNNDLINTRFTTLESNIGNFYELKNKIILGYDEGDKGKPYLLFNAAGGLENYNYTMKLTTEKLSFLAKDTVLAYFGNTSMTIKRARINEGIYLGNDNTGYLIIKTTPQGACFTWEDSFVE